MSNFEENYVCEKPRPFLKRGEGLKRRFNIDPDKFRLNNLPRYKYAIKSAQSHSLNKCNELWTSRNLRSCSAQANSSQQLAITSMSSTNCVVQTTSKSEDDIKSDKKQLSLLSWADILNPQLINPIAAHDIRGSMSSTAICNQYDEANDTLSLFELLEQKANISLAMLKDKSRIKKQQNQETLNSSRNNNINIVSASLKPLVTDLDLENMAICDSDLNDISIDDENSEKEFDGINLQNNNSPEKSVYSSNGEDNSATNSCFDQTEKAELRKHCSDDTLFEDFKKTLFGVLQERANSHVPNSKAKIEAMTSQKEKKSHNFIYFDEDMEEKAKLIEKRLFELEKEINNFKQENSKLLKAKEEFAIEYEKFHEDSKEAVEKLNDERINFEIYMHDEQIKLDLDKQKMEQQIKMLKTQFKCKQNKNMADLKAENEKLKYQLREKELDHSSAQARLRSQICNLKKEISNMHEKIEQLVKENKKIEYEKQNLARGNNNKILQEVNRNIALLTAKSELTTTKLNDEKKQTKNINDSKRVTNVENESDIRMENSTNLSNVLNVCNERRSNSLENDGKDNSLEKSLDKMNKVMLNDDEASKLLEGEFKKEIVNEDGSREIWYPNGNLKKISADAMTIRMLYFNHDIKETYINDGMVKYYYAATNVWHTTYLDGLEILEFPNGQTEHRYRNGLVEVHFPNKSVKIVNPADQENIEEWRFANGTNLVQKRNGDKILILPDGQKEVHTKMCRQRVYPDGTVKVIYPDGSQETRYSNGRIRLKDTDGNLLMDTST